MVKNYLRSRFFVAARIGPVLLALVAFASCQSAISEIAGSDEVSVRYEWVYKKGDTHKYAVKFGDISRAIPLPTAYASWTNKYYLIKTDAIVSGDNVLSVKVSVPKVDQFGKLRILHLVDTELMPSGREWRDCTILPKYPTLAEAHPEYGAQKRVFDAFNEKMAKFMPNVVEQKVHCVLDDALARSGDYFAVVSKTEDEPAQPFTKFIATLDSVEKTPGEDQSIYRITIKNAGSSTASEVNFRSGFDPNTTLVSVTPERGRCQRSTYGTSWGTTVCYLGVLKPSDSVTVKFVGKPAPAGLAGEVEPGVPNRGWHITLLAKQNPNDPAWPVNWMRFTPLN
jgi:uncharacterized repeat protein (TIGR01451 family)